MHGPWAILMPTRLGLSIFSCASLAVKLPLDPPVIRVSMCMHAARMLMQHSSEGCSFLRLPICLAVAELSCCLLPRPLPGSD